MADMRPSPQTTLGILLGASKWPHSSLQDSQAFARSAQKVRDYFLHSERFGLRQENWLDLFDRNQSSPYEVDKRISTFLQERISLMKQAGMPARDLLFYYIGHGTFALGSDQAFHLAIRSTHDESLRASAVAMAALAETIKTNARQLRRLVILDCCFAAEAFKYMQSAPYQAAQKQTISSFEEKSRGHGFPRKGTTLLCSSGQKEASLLLPDESGTMFSEAFVQTLVLGNTRQRKKTHLSLYDVKTVLEGVLEHSTKGNAPRPFVGSPDQSDGDVASVPLFPNSQHDKYTVKAITPLPPQAYKFTEKAKRVFSLAQDIARGYQHDYIGTEHLLLGLVHERESIAAKILANLGIELNTIRGVVEYLVNPENCIVLSEIGLTPRAKKIVNLAVDEAIHLNHRTIGTGHLLIGMVHEGEGIAWGVLDSLGVSLEKVRIQASQVLSQHGSNNIEP